jgi:CheY-like chemotaxis protein
VPKTLLAVDDSATMRKVLEITFGGEDFRVLSADGSQKALAHLSEEPIAAVIDLSLDDDGYALAKEIRGRDGRVAIVLMASRYNPYDAGRGKAAGADDSIDKPFDTQALIDKVKKAIQTREASSTAAAAPPPPPPPPQAAPAPAPVHQAPAPAVVAPFSTSPRPPAVAPAARPAFPSQQRSHTLSFEGGSATGAPPPPAGATAPPAVVPGVPPALSPISRTAPSGVPVFQPPAEKPAPAPPTAATVTPTRTSPVAVSTSPSSPTTQSPIAAVVNGQLAGKLGDLGLSQAQIEGVLALSRDVVERVVWEVVPQLAETMIKEEIARLTKD